MKDVGDVFFFVGAIAVVVFITFDSCVEKQQLRHDLTRAQHELRAAEARCK